MFQILKTKQRLSIKNVKIANKSCNFECKYKHCNVYFSLFTYFPNGKLSQQTIISCTPIFHNGYLFLENRLVGAAMEMFVHLFIVSLTCADSNKTFRIILYDVR